MFLLFLGDADDVGIPHTNTWYFHGYDTDKCFDEYFNDPTAHAPPTVYLGFPCTKVKNAQMSFLAINRMVCRVIPEH